MGFDFDGVIADTAEAFIRLCCDEYGYCSIRLEDITDFDVGRCLDMNPAVVEAVFTRILHDSVGVGLRPMDGAVAVLEELTAKGPVTMVTARPDPDPVRHWVDVAMPPSVGRNITIIAMGEHDDKPRYAHDHGLQFFVDDRAETCHQLMKAGIRPVVFAQPWNRGRHSFLSVSSWGEIRTLCF